MPSFVAFALLLIAAPPQLVVSNNHRYLQTTDGRPFFWLGDTGWLMFQRLNREEVERYLEDRRQKGFNVIQCMILHAASNKNAYGAAALRNSDPGQPNITPGSDLGKPAEYDYWDHIDWIADRAAEKGIYLAMVPAWGSIARSGKLNATNVETYARFLANRYRGRSSVIWLNGGDTHGDKNTSVWRTLGRTLKEHDPNHLITFHPFGRTQSSTWFHDEPWLDFNMFQSGHRRYDQDESPGAKGEDNWRYVQEDYARMPTKPTIDGEPSYEGIPQGLHDPNQPLWTDKDVRRYAYWSVFAGSFGHTYGHAAVMQMRKPEDAKGAYGTRKLWSDAIDDPGAGHMQHLKNLMLSRPFFERVPDPTLVAGQNGTRYEYIAATRGDHFAMLYTYTGRPIPVNLSRVPGKTLQAWWFDPRTGATQTIGKFEKTDSRTFTPPGAPSPGNDWVLVLDDATGNFPAPAQISYEQQVRPVIARYCSGCHNEKVATAGLNLNAYANAESAKQSQQVWVKVLDKLSSGKMPPPGLPAPKPEERSEISRWIQSFVSQSSLEDPGRVTARRLNRLEYNNTIRDLLHVDAKPADEFPVDDSGYGFDNIGDVLSLSPMLMEKYLAAAKKLSRLAVYGELLPSKPTTLGRYVTKRSPDATGNLTAPGITPFSLRGSLFATHVFPWTAEYEFRFRVVNFRYVLRGRNAPPLSPEEAKKLFPPIDAILTLDGKRVASATVEGSLAHDYERGDIVARVPVTAGEHRIRISFPDLADMKDPRDNVNVDQRRKLWIDFLNIVGPFQPSQEPSESYKALFVCGHAPGKHQPSCARKVIRNFAERAYRRPITESELSKLLNIAALARKHGEPFGEAIRLAVQAALVSPHFLFRIERDPATPDAKPHPISDYELASRLSYFLWSSMPDEELFRLASENRLHEPAVLEAQVRRMLTDAKASSLIDGFAAQWLQLRHLDRVRPDPKRFSAVDDELLAAMREETRLFVSEIIRDDRSVLDFLDGPFTYLNGPLATHYGIPGVSGEQLRLVALDGNQRGGLLTHGSILTISSYPTRTSPVLRGKWILENFLGAPPPPPPPNVPELKEEKLSASSLREQLEIHRANASCATCHDQIDPLGFSLENYDAVGAWRTHDGEFPIDASGTLPGGTKFNGPRELVGILKSRSNVFGRNLTERLMTYALGRGLTPSDNSAVNAIVERSAANGHRFSSIVLGIVMSTPFQMRRAEGRRQRA